MTCFLFLGSFFLSNSARWSGGVRIFRGRNSASGTACGSRELQSLAGLCRRKQKSVRQSVKLVRRISGCGGPGQQLVLYKVVDHMVCIPTPRNVAFLVYF